MQLQTTSRVWFWMQWANTGALQILTWLLSESTLVMMVIQSFKAFGLGWLLKQNSKLTHFSLVCTTWHIEPILLFWFWASYPWLCTLCAFFSHSQKKVLECVNLAKTLETKSLKLLWNIKTRWVSLLNPLKCVLGKYKSRVVKMHTNAPKNKPTWDSLDLLCDLELVLGLPRILPMLEVVHTLIKYAQRWDIFIVSSLMS
jgi:hypothetical protein